MRHGLGVELGKLRSTGVNVLQAAWERPCLVADTGRGYWEVGAEGPRHSVCSAVARRRCVWQCRAAHVVAFAGMVPRGGMGARGTAWELARARVWVWECVKVK